MSYSEAQANPIINALVDSVANAHTNRVMSVLCCPLSVSQLLVYTSDGFLPQVLLFRFAVPECAATIKYSSLVRVTLSVLAVITHCVLFLMS